MMKPKNLMLVTVAAILGIAAALLANHWVTNRLARTADGTPVVVAAVEMPYGQKIDAGHVKIVSWPEASVPAGSFRNVADVASKVVNQRLVPNEPLLKDRVVDNLEGSTLAAMVDPEKRAVTVRVNDVIGVAGFLLPGNRVDVLASRKMSDRAHTEMLLQDLKVLAVDQTASPDKDKPVVVRAVTLEVLPKEATMLVNATVEGTVHLTLRNPVAKTVALAEPPARVRVAAPKVAVAREPDVTFIRGSSVELSDRKL